MNMLNATPAGQRIVELDLIRGLALFGIIVVNIAFFGLPFYTVMSDLYPFSGTLDAVSRAMVDIFFTGKFISLFSFLFGLGFWIFASRARAKGRMAGPLFLRRIFILALFGILHGILFWAGDVLLPYAVIGLLLMLFLNRSDRTLRIWIFLFPVLFLLFYAGMVQLMQIGLNVPEAKDQILASFDESRQMMEQTAIAATEAYRSTDIGAMISIRMKELAFAWQGLIFAEINAFYLLALFLCGVYAGRRNWFQNMEDKLPVMRRYLPWLLIAGLLSSLLRYYFSLQAEVIMPTWESFWVMLLHMGGSPLLTASYVIMLVLAYHRWKNARIWTCLGAAGRMSLTVYLTQSIILSLVFFGYGAGLYGTIPTSGMVLIAVGVFALQLLAAGWWIQRFHMGPFEWIWRAATYGHFSPFRKNPDA